MLEVEREDRPAYVRFERRPVEDAAATLKAGRSVCKDVDYALVTPPYSKDCVEYKVKTWLENMDHNIRRKRIPAEWAKQWKEQYKQWQEGNEAPVNGTDIKNWSVLSPAQVQNLLSAGCRTVEDLAQANDQAIRSIGMGANDLKRKAVTYLQAATDHGPVVMQNAQLERENSELKGTIASMKAQLDALSGQVHALGNAKFEVNEEPVEQGITASDILDEAPTIKPDIDPELTKARNLYFEKFSKKAHHFKGAESIMKDINA